MPNNAASDDDRPHSVSVHESAGEDSHAEDGWETDLSEQPDHNPNALSPLHSAAMFGDVATIQALLRSGRANVDRPGPGGHTALWMAICRGQLESIRVLLDHNADPDSDRNQCSVLDLAASRNNLEAVRLIIERGNPSPKSRAEALSTTADFRVNNAGMVRFLLQNGADPRGSSKSGPAICRAVSNKNLETVKALLEHHADVNDYGNGGYSALHDVETHFWVNDPTGESSEPPSVTMTKVLLEAGADINACTEMENFTPVHIHLKRRTQVLKTILDAKPDLEIKTSPTCYVPSMTPLALAVWEEKVEAAKLLLAAGADPNSKTGYKGGAPLHLGMKEDLVRALLEYDADLHLENDEGDTPLNALLSLTREEKKDEFVVVGDVWAPEKETGITLPVIEMLLAKGSDVNYPNKAGQTPLFKALNKPDLAIARLLLSRGANPNHISREDGMPLHSACRNGTWEAFRLMFDKVGFAEEALYGIGSLVNATCMRDGGEEVPLQILKHLRKTAGRQKMHLNQKCGSYGCALSSACFWSSEGVIGWLLKHGARVRTKDHAGRRPIHFAAYRNTSIFSQICEAGGDITARDKIGRSVLHIAVQSGSAALVKLILEKDPSLLHARDKDNWAPLHYAVRGCWHFARRVREPIDSQTDIVKLLLDDGICPAPDFKVRGHEDENWSILKLAWYHGAKAEVRRMLETSLKKQQGRNWDPLSERVERANRHNFRCGYCLMSIRGFRYHCKQCVQFNLCYKCHSRKNKVHPGHYWDTVGPEFTEEDDYMEDDESTDEDESMGEDGEDDDESMEEDVHVEYNEDHSMEDDSDTDDSGSEDEL